MTLLPFTIEAWDHGRGLQPCTADGREVKQLTLFECDASSPLFGVIDKAIRSWMHDGTTHGYQLQSCDLRLRPKTEKRTVILVRGQITGDVLANLIIGPVNPEPYPREIARVEIEVPV